MASSDINNYDDVNKFLVFVPSVRIFGSRSSGLRLAIKLMIDDHMLVDFGVKIGARMIVGSVLLLLVMTHGT